MKDKLLVLVNELFASHKPFHLVKDLHDAQMHFYFREDGLFDPIPPFTSDNNVNVLPNMHYDKIKKALDKLIDVSSGYTLELCNKIARLLGEELQTHMVILGERVEERREEIVEDKLRKLLMDLVKSTPGGDQISMINSDYNMHFLLEKIDGVIDFVRSKTGGNYD